MLCKGCGQDKDLIKAHVIPEAFFRGLRHEKNHPRIITDVQGVYPKKAPIGVYDKEILCLECEGIFANLDDYGQSTLLQNSGRIEELKRGAELLGYAIRDIDLDLFKLFLIGVLWRASVSSHDFYAKVKLGPYEKRIKDVVWNRLALGVGEFSYVMSRFKDDKLGKTMLNPHPERWYGVKYYRIYMFGYVVHIKVDKLRTPNLFRPFEMGGKGDLFMVAREIENSAELDAIIAVAGKSKK